MKSAFKLSQKYTVDTNKIKKQNERELQTILTIENDSESSEELDDINKIQIETQRSEKNKTINKEPKNNSYEDEDDKKTVKYTDRTYGNDEIVRQIISNNEILSDKKSKSSKSSADLNLKLFIRNELQDDKERSLEAIKDSEIRLDINADKNK